jgi:LysM domain
MTVAPELPPVPAARRAGVGPARRRPQATAVHRTPAGVLALVEPPLPRRALTVVPEPAPWDDSPVAPAVEAGTGRVHRPAGPVRLRPVGARVVRPAGGGLRLTRRGRVVAALATVLIAVLTLVGVASRVGSLSESAPVPPSAPAQVVVAPGETLWSIAERVAPERDPRTVVARIRQLNGMSTGDVRAGQTLLLRAP